MRRKSPASPVLLGGAAGAPKSKTRTAQCNSRCVHDVWLLTFPPVGDAEKRSADGRCPGPMSEAHVLCGPSLGPGPLARASQGSRVATVTSGSPFLGPVFDRRKSPEGIGEAKEGTRSPQGSETARSRERTYLAPRRGVKPPNQTERVCPRSEEPTPWIPASAGMTKVFARSHEIASSASPPRNDPVGQ